MPEHNSTHNSNENDGFSPWLQWTSETDVCFHNHVAQGIKEKSLSADQISAIVLQLLTKANETALALLKEIRYVDSPWACEINAQSLVTAQCHILEVCNILKGRSGTVIDSKPMGKRMLCAYPDITLRCYAAAVSLDAFYCRFDMWLCGLDEKCSHVVQIMAFLVNALDAMQQCHMSVCPSAYSARNEQELERALGRARQALRTAINSFNAASLPKNDGEQLTEKSVLLTNIYWLMAMFKLLDAAARRTFSIAGVLCPTAYHNTGAINRCCRLRIAILRKKASKYMAVTDSSGQQNLVCSTAIWALNILDDEIDAISSGTYDNFGQVLHYTTEINAETTECLSILALLRLAYIRAKEQNSTTAKTIERNYKILKDAKILCARLKLCGSRNIVDSNGVEKLYDVLSYLESVRSDLMSIHRHQLLHAQWSYDMLKQAVKAADTALSVCESTLKSIIEPSIAVANVNNSPPSGKTFPVLTHPRVGILRERYGGGIPTPRSGMHVRFDQVDSACVQNTHGGGGIQIPVSKLPITQHALVAG